MPHHYGWRFMDIGRFLDRVLGLLSLLKLTLNAPHSPGLALWEVVLATTDNFTAYRRRYRSELHPEAILDLLLFDETNPRSVGYMLNVWNGRWIGCPAARRPTEMPSDVCSFKPTPLCISPTSTELATWPILQMRRPRWSNCWTS